MCLVVCCLLIVIISLLCLFFCLMIRRPPRTTPLYSSAASSVYKRQVSSWPPRLPSSTLDAHWPPLEAQYLGCTRLASTAGHISVDLRERGGGECVVCWCYYTSSARAIWLLPSAPPPSPSLPLAAHRLSSPEPHPKSQKCHLATTSSRHLTPSMSTL